MIYNDIIGGNIFKRDTRKVLNLLKELTIVTDAETWVKGLKYGRRDMRELQAHYNRTS